MKYGGIESPKDTRDIQLGKIQSPMVIPDEYITDIAGVGSYYQDGKPSCGGHAGAHLIRLFEKLEGFELEVSPRFVYALCKKIDGYPHDGTFLRSIMKVLATHGACREDLFPNDINLPDDMYRDYNLIEQSALSDAQDRIIKSYAFLSDISFQGLKQAIYQNKAVIVLAKPWGIGSEPLHKSGAVTDGHFILLYGYKKDKIYFLNSFGNEWGVSGKGYFTEDYIDCIKEGATAIDIPNWMVKNLTNQVTILKKIVELLLLLKSTWKK